MIAQNGMHPTFSYFPYLRPVLLDPGFGTLLRGDALQVALLCFYIIAERRYVQFLPPPQNLLYLPCKHNLYRISP